MTIATLPPKPWIVSNPKAFVLGCDPTAYSSEERKKDYTIRQHIIFDTVFDLSKGLKYFRKINDNLKALNLSRRYVYVQNLVIDYQKEETSKNKEWVSIAEPYIKERKAEFDRINSGRKVPVFLTSELLLKVLLNNPKDYLKPLQLYSSDNEFYIPAEKNRLGRPLIPLYRHQDYALEKWPEYSERIRKEFNFKRFSENDKIVIQKYRSKAQSSFKTKLDLFLFAKSLIPDENELDYHDFQSFKINKSLVKQYSAEFWQFENEYNIAGRTIGSIYNHIVRLKKEYNNLIKQWEKRYCESEFDVIFPLQDFVALLNIGKCEYCNINEEDIDDLADHLKLWKKSHRGWSLEIDRKDSNYEYTKNNCVMACYWCNNAKTDEFTHEEFRKVGKVIKKIWADRLSAI